MNKTQESSSESIEHIRIKRFLYDNLPLHNQIVFIKQEYRTADQIADLYIELINGIKIAIEIQHSKITKKDLIVRTKNYNQEGISVLWILNGNGPYYYRIPKNEQGVIVSSSEKVLHNLYQGRVYYMNMAKDKVVAPIYSVHFSSYYRKKLSSYESIHYKKSTMKRSLVYSLISSLNLKVFSNSGLKLVRFSDQNIKKQCKNDVVHLMNAFIIYQSKKAPSSEAQGLPLGYIIRRFSKLYGKFLLFDVLKELRFLKNQDIKYFLNEELHFKKHLLS